MTDLYGSSILKIEQQSSQLEYQIADAGDRAIAVAEQVSGPKPRKGLRALLGSGLKDARVVVQVSGADSGPDKPPLFYVDHQTGAPVAIVGADGALVGRYVHQPVDEMHQMAAARLTGRTPAMTHRLVDAHDRPVCEIAWTLRPGGGEYRAWAPVACDFTTLDGAHIAHVDVHAAAFKDRYDLQLMFQLNEPLRTLVIAAPLAYDLTRS
ncbi:hypothetical protein [Actinomadura rudentiformis]|uniref:Scramblase n=1 Tax=Actinomadura rudentiformis TaxID=359158 RepID=A0A6H9YR77_9ACTN|nr:hypothetical protein [Actinomadura rudentiformis]KAB2347821.1 hypothetical protein F8566_18180 [Actinomadura rudentiformis]